MLISGYISKFWILVIVSQKQTYSEIWNLFKHAIIKKIYEKYFRFYVIGHFSDY